MLENAIDTPEQGSGQAENNQKLKEWLQSLLTDVQAKTSVPGISVAFMLNGQSISANVGKLISGHADAMHADARFQLGSLTKLLTALVVVALVQEGKLNHEATIGEYLDEFSATDKGKSICLWHLLSHTSGLQSLNLADPDVAYGYTWDRLTEHFINSPQLFRPGSVASFDDAGYVILGEIICRVTGKTLADIFDEILFKPLGLKAGRVGSDLLQHNQCYVGDHGFHPQEQRFNPIRAEAYGAMWESSLSDITLSISDLSKLGFAMLNAMEDGDGTSAIFSGETVAFLQKQVLLLPKLIVGTDIQEHLPSAFGVTCAAFRGWLLGMNGSARGQSTALRVDPRLGISLAVGLNTPAPPLRDAIVSHIFSVLRGQELPALPVVTKIDVPIELFSGRYQGAEGADLLVTVDKEQIHLDLGNRCFPHRQQFSVLKSAEGAFYVNAPIQPHAVAFLLAPETGIPCVQLDLLVFKKEASK